ncbi:TPA: hypothetical protein ACX6QT_000063 [Photobacterium damselae]|uniref:hypothetical protein n=1 Tax=Photobacterium damselae TaxID=38293 RepID=UPI001EDF84CD|nr:hypothetical protein [Photobacterium damselae]MCG3844443.1 hypothetical protein [Photobacterium damselae]
MAITVDFGDVIALLAFGMAVYSTKKTLDFNKRQKEFIETNDRLNKLLLRKEKQEAISAHQADLSANFICVGKNNRKLKVFNKGKATARNVRIEFPDGNPLLMESDIDQKFPIPILEQYQSVELIATYCMNSPSRMTIKLNWDDATGIGNEKILTPTIM